MIVLILFLSLFIGINIRYSFIVGIIELILLLIFVFFRFKKKVLLLSSIFILSGVGLSYIRFDFNKESYQGMVVEVKDNYYVFSSSLEKMYIYEPNHSHEIGDVLLISGEKKELDFATLESEFDFKDYLNRKGIYYELKYKSIEVKSENPIKLHKFKKEFLSKFDENTGSVISSLLFGESKSSEFTDLGREMHLMRLVSSSGIYLSFIYLLVFKLLLLLIKNERYAHLFAVFLLSPLFVLSFPKFIVIKFFALKIVRWINNYPLKRKFSYLEITSFSAIAFLFIDPNLARQDGFILSYFIPLIFLYIRGSFHFSKKWKSSLFLLLAVMGFFIPFSIKYYSEISLFALPIQLLFTPLYIFLFLLAILGLMKIPIYGFISTYGNVMFNSLKAINNYGVYIYTGSISEVGILIYELLYLGLLYFLSIRLKPISRISILSFSVLLLYYLVPFQGLKSYVSFINVGQGDSTLIHYKNTAILIDTGGLKNKDVATDVLIPFFKKRQIYKLDLVITTHDDFDHSGALTSLVSNFKVNRYVSSYQDFPLTINNITINNYNNYSSLWDEDNDRSLVLGFHVDKYDYLVMGDAPKKIEEAIMKDYKYIPCDILKVGHHGSNTSTSDVFVNFLKPKVAIISCGKNNYYGHPHNEVIAILYKYNVSIRRTDYESTITF